MSFNNFNSANAGPPYHKLPQGSLHKLPQGSLHGPKREPQGTLADLCGFPTVLKAKLHMARCRWYPYGRKAPDGAWLVSYEKIGFGAIITSFPGRKMGCITSNRTTQIIIGLERMV